MSIDTRNATTLKGDNGTDENYRCRYSSLYDSNQGEIMNPEVQMYDQITAPHDQLQFKVCFY